MTNLYNSDYLKEFTYRVKNKFATAVQDSRKEMFIPRPSKRKASTKYTIFHSFDKVKKFSPEEIKQENEAYAERNAEGLKIALKDGYVEIPIFLDNIYGKSTEMKAWIPKDFEPSFAKGFFEKHGMDYNIYIPSHNRSTDCATAEMLKSFDMTNWYLMVNPEEYEDYHKVYPSSHIILRDINFHQPNMVHLTTSIKRPITMAGTAGCYNNQLAFSRSIGEDKFFTMDDDFAGVALKTFKGPGLWKNEYTYKKEDFYRCSNLEKRYGFDFAEYLHILESFSQKLRNHGFIGIEKFGLTFAMPPCWRTGTRVYSFYLTNCHTQINHIGAMNNDVITSIEQSKHGFPPCLIEVVGYNSKPTQTSGGLTEQYKLLGTLEKGKILVKNEPNYARINYHFNRVHHFVNYNFYTHQHLVGAIKKKQN